MVGSTVFGRYPKISVEQTYNMIISDGFLVPYAGHRNVATVVPEGDGRAIFTSIPGVFMIAVIDEGVYRVAANLSTTRISSLATFLGDVYIDENNAKQIGICDRQNIYIYNYDTNVFQTAVLDFIPGFISFQNGRFISVDLTTGQWRLSDPNNGLSWPNDIQHVGQFQTKPDKAIAAQRFPGRGNLLYVFGNTVIEPWQDAGLALFPYQRNSTVNIDYGCLNPATIAFNDSIIVWLAANEKSGPMIAFSTGGDIQKISTDGIDFKLATLTNPSNAYGFLFRQDGHMIYQITFPDDNLTYIYDFNTKKFFSLSDEYMNAHIAKRVTFFNDKYYFVSFTDGNIYELNTAYTTYNGKEIPRIRVCRNIRMPDASRFVVNNITFTLEQGTQEWVVLPTGLSEVTVSHFITEDGNNLVTENGNQLIATELENHFEFVVPQKVALSVSKNGGQSFGTIWSKELNAPGIYKNRLIYWNLGAANDFVPQFRFWGLGRFVATDGIVSLYQ